MSDALVLVIIYVPLIIVFGSICCAFVLPPILHDRRIKENGTEVKATVISWHSVYRSGYNIECLLEDGTKIKVHTKYIDKCSYCKNVSVLLREYNGEYVVDKYL